MKEDTFIVLPEKASSLFLASLLPNSLVTPTFPPPSGGGGSGGAVARPVVVVVVEVDVVVRGSSGGLVRAGAGVVS